MPASIYIPEPGPVVREDRKISREWLFWFQTATDQLSAAGNVHGPASALDGQIALFDGTTGELLRAATGTGIVNVVGGVYQTPYTIGTNLVVVGTTLDAISWVPMSDGANPPNIVDDGAGNFIFINYVP